MSSTTDRCTERGQALAIFALMSVVLVGMAALAFDVGMVTYEKRIQQNAADAAALAGARFLPGNTGAATSRAVALAAANGYVSGGTVTVAISFPAATRIRVTITNNRPSLFAGVMGMVGWDVGATAVAANEENPTGPFALLSLDPTACPGLLVEGTGRVESNGNVQVNSTCASGNAAFRVAGSGGLYLTGSGISCNVVGGSSSGGGVVQNDCNPANNGAAAIPDPYETLADPPVPATAAAPVQVAGATMPIPVGCPGAGAVVASPGPSVAASPGPTVAATATSPAACRFPGSYAGTTWRLFPGYYPGGINLEAGTFYMEPGIYYVAGGFDPGGTGGPVSFRAAGAGVTLLSVAPNGSALGGGVLIFNGEHPTLPDGKIILGGNDANVNLLPLDAGTRWDNMVIFQDRDIALDLTIAGGSSNMQVRGVIYAAAAKVVVNGGGSTLTMDQIIAATYQIRGNGGTIRLEYDSDYLPDFSMAGLVE